MRGRKSHFLKYGEADTNEIMLAKAKYQGQMIGKSAGSSKTYEVEYTPKIISGN